MVGTRTTRIMIHSLIFIASNTTISASDSTRWYGATITCIAIPATHSLAIDVIKIVVGGVCGPVDIITLRISPTTTATATTSANNEVSRASHTHASHHHQSKSNLA